MWLSWVLCPGSHQAEIEMSARAAVSSELWAPFPSSLVVSRIKFLIDVRL